MAKLNSGLRLVHEYIDGRTGYGSAGCSRHVQRLCAGRFSNPDFLNEAWCLPGETCLWDSGRVQSGDCVGIAYGGSALARGGRYAWQVRYGTAMA